jgi:pyruvate,water dikinase
MGKPLKGDGHMSKLVKHFRELTDELQVPAGGKGGMLGRMFREGYPVPEGIVVFPGAFKGGRLNDEAWKRVQSAVGLMRKEHEGVRFAVRSSALGEDSAQASFAGEFESVLNVRTDEEIAKAIDHVYRSAGSDRVKAYSEVKGMIQDHRIAVVIQVMVQSEVSGVLFTADPVTGSHAGMPGNYVEGLGEKLVSGESDAGHFELRRPTGKYLGPQRLEPFGPQLYKIASRLEKEMGIPQDIEWAIEKGKLYLLQARPITTLSGVNLETYEMNYSLTGDELWINTNVAEAIPDVFTPFSWSMGKKLDEALNFIPGYHIFSGNIYGRPYMNISRRVSVIQAVLGKNSKGAMKLITDMYGELPQGMKMPIHPFSRGEVIRVILPIALRTVRGTMKASKNLPRFLEEAPGKSERLGQEIRSAKTREGLLLLWKEEIQPYVIEAWLSAGASAVKMTSITTLDRKLTAMTGAEDSNILLSNLRGGQGLASMGPVLGISKVMAGEMSREEYLRDYGHRSAHEYELSIADPMEDPEWVDRQVAEFQKGGIDVAALLGRQHAQYENAKARFVAMYPGKAKWLDRKLKKASEGARLRERGRSAFVRAFRLVREFALKAGALTGLGEDIFFLYVDEVEELLEGRNPKVWNIPIRKENVEKYRAMPPMPSYIRGRFNPEEWVKDPERRLDVFDASMPPEERTDVETLKGYPGASGRVEGTVRVLTRSEEGDALLPGEVLVASTTNIGWTPLFPKAAAIITDIGAPLSHAAIVAREMGIPAVVGCGNATMRLKTGDRVMVDGGHGIVHILEQKRQEA